MQSIDFPNAKALATLISPDPPFPTGIEALDKTFNGGIPLEKITEVHGHPSTGRFCFWYNCCSLSLIFVSLQAALEYLIRDPEGQVIWIDPLRSFSVIRAIQLLEARGIPKGPRQNSILDRIILGREDELNRIEAFLRALPEDSAVGLLVIGNVAALFQNCNFDSVEDRVTRIKNFGRLLRQSVFRCQFTALIINQMTTRFKVDPNNGGQEVSYVVPSLGETWQIFPDVIIRLEHDGSDPKNRQMYIIHTRFQDIADHERIIPFKITVNQYSAVSPNLLQNFGIET